MKQLFYLHIFLNLILLLNHSPSYATKLNDADLPISHCYHWLKEDALDYKMKHAEKNNGELSIYTTTTNNKRGDGLYCAKTPLTSTDYGTRVIRIDFVEDVVANDIHKNNLCGVSSTYPQDLCADKKMDLDFYDADNDWYVIKNQEMVLSWSANSTQLINDLKESKLDAKNLNDDDLKIKIIGKIDDAIKLIQKEVDSKKQKTYHNGHSRLSLDQILGNANEIKKYPELTLIGMIQSSGTLSPSEKSKWIQTLVDRALQNKDLKPSDFENIFGSNKSYNDILKVALYRVDFNQINKYNIIPLIQLVDKIANKEDHKGNSWKKEFKILLVQLLKDEKLKQISEILQSIQNPNLEMVKASQEVLFEQAKNNFETLNPITTGLFLDLFKDQLSNSDFDHMKLDILKLPWKINKTPSYNYVIAYENAQITLPSFYDYSNFMIKIVERALSERTHTQEKTNIFRLILSNFYQHYVKEMENTYASNHQDILNKAYYAFRDLASWLYSNGYYGYAYIAVQNSGAFQSKRNYTYHPLEVQIAEFEKYQSQDALVFNSIAKSLDKSILIYLLNQGFNESPNTTLKLITSIFQFLNSNELTHYLQSKDFAIVNEEKKSYGNNIDTQKVAADFCAFLDELDNSKIKLQKIDPNGFHLFEGKMTNLKLKFCN